MVPPARSILVGADETMRTARLYESRIPNPHGTIGIVMPLGLRRQIGQLLIAGFNGQQIPAELRSLAREFGLGGVILFTRNIAEPTPVAAA